MKDKLIHTDDLNNALGTAGRSLGTVSPFPNILGPTTTLFYDLRGSATYTSVQSLAVGTLDRWRTDFEDPLPLNRDQSVLFTTGTPSLLRIVERKAADIDSHWADQLPHAEVGGYPNWADNLVNNTLKKQGYSK